MHTGDNDQIVPVRHRLAIAWFRFADLKRTLTATRLSKLLHLCFLSISMIYTLLCGCEVWKLTEYIRRKINSTVSTNAFIHFWECYCRRSPQNVSSFFDAGNRPTMELAGPHPPHWWASNSWASPPEICQMNPQLGHCRNPSCRHQESTWYSYHHLEQQQNTLNYITRSLGTAFILIDTSTRQWHILMKHITR